MKRVETLLVIALTLGLVSYANNAQASAIGNLIKLGKLAVKYAPQLADLKFLGESRETIQKNYHLEFSSETRQLQEAEKPNNSVEKQTNSELLRNLAWEKAKDKNHLDAIKYYEAALQQNANNGKIWHGYAWSLSELKRYDEASNAYLIAIDKLGNQHEKGTDESWRYLGWNFQRQNPTTSKILL